MTHPRKAASPLPIEGAPPVPRRRRFRGARWNGLLYTFVTHRNIRR
jgi:hypothetical protein